MWKDSRRDQVKFSLVKGIPFKFDFKIRFNEKITYSIANNSASFVLSRKNNWEDYGSQ